jgi:hypothetical protein
MDRFLRITFSLLAFAGAMLLIFPFVALAQEAASDPSPDAVLQLVTRLVGADPMARRLAGAALVALVLRQLIQALKKRVLPARVMAAMPIILAALSAAVAGLDRYVLGGTWVQAIVFAGGPLLSVLVHELLDKLFPPKPELQVLSAQAGEPPRSAQGGFVALGLVLPLAVLFAAVGMLFSGCGATFAAGTLVVDSVTAAARVYGPIANKAEDDIRAGAIAACSGTPNHAAYRACTDAYVAPRRKPYDVCDVALEDYEKAASLGASVDPAVLRAVGDKAISALAAVGITVAGGK